LLLYAVSIFFGALLLFLVQPMMAQFILPWFGGSSLVWTTSMLFFQSGLVLGYAYAHGSTQRLQPWTQWIVHVILISAAILFLPVRPAEDWKPLDGQWPTWRVLLLLAATVGVPYVALATTGPLIQRWQSLSHPKHSPYRLFALSNLGSLLALVGFPLIFENFLRLEQQSWLWSAGFTLYALVVLAAGFQYYRRMERTRDPDQASASGTPTMAAAGGQSPASTSAMMDRDDEPIAAPATINTTTEPSTILGTGPLTHALYRLTWFLLPLLASVQLLATTNFLTQEVGAHPFLWILPLALYLLTFIICFEWERLYFRPIYFAGLAASAIYACIVFEAGIRQTFVSQVLAYCSVLLCAAMICHGELARLKPQTRTLTEYYLWIAIGGAAGGVLVALVAPLCFNDYYEFHLSLLTIAGVAIARMVPEAIAAFQKQPKPFWKLASLWWSLTGAVVAASGVTSAAISLWQSNHASNVVAMYRNEYGVVTIKNDKESNSRILYNGKTMHGFQLDDLTLGNEPTSYYSPGSGLGLAVRYLQNGLDPTIEPQLGRDGRATRMAAIGLGTGTLAAWVGKQDHMRFFEIDPKVVVIANQHFRYLATCRGSVDLSLGDARIQLEREEINGEPQYDLLIADAFSSDSIPKHLLTNEALELYIKRIKPNGIIAIHVSNRFVDLAPLLQRQAEDLNIPAVYTLYSPDKKNTEEQYYDATSWVLLTNNQAFLDHPLVNFARRNWPEQASDVRWTDDYTPLIPLLRD
jgi:hypothetical protein